MGKGWDCKNIGFGVHEGKEAIAQAGCENHTGES